MATTTLRVSEETRARAAALASERGSSIGAVVDAALEALERGDFWRQTRDALERHPQHAQPEAGWESTLRDGLERE